MEIKVRVPRFKDGKPDGFNYHLLRTLPGLDYNFGNPRELTNRRGFTYGQPELWSGFHDKNGTEIYYNDIIHLLQYPGEVLTTVVFHKGAFCLHGFNWDVKNCFVFGNVHENSDLINGIF